ncbi:MAG: MoxR family ATPase [Sphingomonadales bacterium]
MVSDPLAFRLDADDASQAADQADRAAQRLHAVRQAVEAVVLGQRPVVELALVTLLAGGHGLIVGLPGLAKTLLVQTLGTVLGLAVNRVQFTPDLLPSDILGSEVLEESPSGARQFRFIKGPIFCQLLMADEINRASPRTQSALLQAMQEHHVSIAGVRHDLDQPFHVLATQNPIEQEGTYPLPEAQLDRFMMEIAIDFPGREAEREMLLATTGADMPAAQPVLAAGELLALQQLVRLMPIGESLVDAIVDLVRAARPQPGEDLLLWGAGPRAAQALMLGCRARALLQGRLAPSLEDVAALAPSVLRHRLALGFAARADGRSVDDVIASLIGRLE